MYTTLLVLDIVVILLLVGSILLQKSEGGGLGLGTSSQGMFSARGRANFLSRATMVLGTIFFALGILLVIVGRNDGAGTPPSILDTIDQNATPNNAPADNVPIDNVPIDNVPVPGSGAEPETPSSDGVPLAK